MGQALDLGLAFVWEVLPAVQVPFKCRLGANCACVENAEWDLQWGGDSVYCQGVLCIEKTELSSGPACWKSAVMTVEFITYCLGTGSVYRKGRTKELHEPLSL